MSHLISGLYTPLSIVLIVGIYLSFYLKKNIYLFFASIIILSAFIRGVYGIKNIVSSRYYAAFIVYAIVYLGVVSKCFLENKQNRNPNKRMIISVTIIVLGVNLYLTFTSFTNLYLIDIKDFFYFKKTKEGEINLLSEMDEADRLGAEVFYNERLINNDDLVDRNTTVSNIVKRYYYWGYPLYFSIKRKNTDSSVKTIDRLQLAGSFITNKNATSRRLVYRIAPYCYDAPEKEAKPMDDSLIKNGNFEQIDDMNAFRSKLRKWINCGEEFYSDKTLLEPKHVILLEYWKSIEGMKYPHIFLDSENVIEGQYSLHIVFRDNARVFLLNDFVSQPGYLSFKLKNFGNESVLTIKRNDYGSDDKFLSSNLNYYVCLKGNTVREYRIPFSETDFEGTKSLLYLEAHDADFLIDNVTYFADCLQ